jgi:hypothetical protein
MKLLVVQGMRSKVISVKGEKIHGYTIFRGTEDGARKTQRPMNVAKEPASKE